MEGKGFTPLLDVEGCRRRIPERDEVHRPGVGRTLVQGETSPVRMPR